MAAASSRFGRCVVRSVFCRGNSRLSQSKLGVGRCLKHAVRRSSAFPFSTSAATSGNSSKLNELLGKAEESSLRDSGNQSIETVEYAPLKVMPFIITQGGKFVVHLLQRFKSEKALVLVRNKVLAKELSTELQEYGYTCTDSISNLEVGDLKTTNTYLHEAEEGIPNVIVMTDDEVKNIQNVPFIDLLIQVQPPSRGQNTTLKFLREAKRRSLRAEAFDSVLLYNQNDLHFLGQIQAQAGVSKMKPPSFYLTPIGSTRHQQTLVHAQHGNLPDLVKKTVHEVEQVTPIPPKAPVQKVYHPLVPVPSKKSERSRLNDRVRLYARGGSGGQGSLGTGGLGGDGGDVILECRQHGTLAHFSVKENRRLIADHGDHFVKQKRKRRGSRGRDLVVPIPLGTTVTTDDGRIIGDLDTVGTRLLVAKGGRGGSPSTEGWNGERGERHMIRLELKLIADVGLIGFPNAGKSTLLGALSRAKPKAADYPFTTVRPTIGIVDYPDFSQVSVADMPGLLEGAHLNRGMGHRFLKHTERTKVLALVVDVNGFQLSGQSPNRTAFQSVCVLLKELALYEPCALLSRPKVLIVNKLDCDGAQKHYETLLGQLDNMERHGNLLAILEEMETSEAFFSPGGLYKLRDYPELSQIKFRDVIPISAMNSVGIDSVSEIFRELVA